MAVGMGQIPDLGHSLVLPRACVHQQGSLVPGMLVRVVLQHNSNSEGLGRVE